MTLDTINNTTIQVSYLTIILLSVTILIVFFIIFQFLKQKYEKKHNELQEEAINKLKTMNEKIELNHTIYETQINNLTNTNKLLEDEKSLIKQSLEDKIKLIEEHEKENRQNIISNYEIKLLNLKEVAQNKEKQLKIEFEIKEENLQEKISLLDDSKKQLKIEFENLANKLFDETQKKSNTNLNQVLGSFKEQLNNFGKRVNDIYSEETKQRVSLLSEIKNLKELNNQISNDAINLTKALKGENKTQGDWGEMILASILEQTGLNEGREYTVQGTFTDENNKRLRPDVIVHLPLKKDIVIDSKVSLTAYLNYTNAENETKKELASKDLIKSITSHIKMLSVKKYEDLPQIQTLDFVLMFIPVEGAFLLATSKDENLFKMAFEHNIMLVSPSTLYVTLRTIENIWRNEHQNENAQIISKKAAALYDKFAAFVSDIEDIGTNLNRTQKSYENAMTKLSKGRGNLIGKSQEFLELGVKPKRQITTKSIQDEDL